MDTGRGNEEIEIVVFPGVRPLNDIRTEIERETEERADLFHRLSQGHDAVLSAGLKATDERIAKLWDEHRQARAYLRFGDRDEIIRRARLEERIDRAA